MEAGKGGDGINPWSVALFRTLKLAEPKTASEQAAYGKWLDQTSDREEARRDRLHGAEGIVPASIWLVLFLIAGCRLRLHALLRRQRRGLGRTSHADGISDDRDRADPNGDQRARAPLQKRSRTDPTGRNGTFAAAPGRRAPRPRPDRSAPVRRPRHCGLSPARRSSRLDNPQSACRTSPLRASNSACVITPSSS